MKRLFVHMYAQTTHVTEFCLLIPYGTDKVQVDRNRVKRVSLHNSSPPHIPPPDAS